VGDAIAAPRQPRSGVLGIAAAVLGGVVAAGAAAAGLGSQGGQLLAILAGLLALAAIGLGFVGFTVARLGGTSRLPGLGAMTLGVLVIAGIVASAVSS
jgi:hypothetical protein